MVDAAFGKTVRIEVVESTVERISVVALLVRIAEDAFADKCVVGLVGLVDVEVSRSFIFSCTRKALSTRAFLPMWSMWRLKNRNSKPVSLHLK